MTPPNRASPLSFLLPALALLLAACDGEGPRRAPAPPPDPVEVVVDVQVEPTAVTLDVGETYTLSALVTTETTEPALTALDEVTWESMSTNVATVAADGTVEALAPGTSLVRATAGGLTAEAVITVREPVVDPPPVVVEVRLAETAVALVAGATRQLAATPVDADGAVVPGATVTWSTQDAAIATVTGAGLVTAVGAGETRVRATSNRISADVIVTVGAVEPPPPPPGVARVELSETDVTLAEGTTLTLTATPRDASGAAIGGLGMIWRTSDEGVVYVTGGGELRAVRAGVADVTVTVHGKVATARVTVTLETAYDLFFEVYAPDRSRFEWMTRDLRDPAAGSVLLMAGASTSGEPVPSPRGDRIAITLSSPLAPKNQLRVLDLQRSTLWYVELPGQVQDVAWSQDGEHLAFALRSEATGFDVWTIRADGTGAVNLTASLGVGNDTQPTWAPASLGKLAFTRTGVDGWTNVWTVDADGANASRLTAGVADADPAWSPDGTTIAFQRSGAATFGDLYFVSPTGAIQRSLYGVPGIQGRPAWSPDGKLLAFTSGGDVYTVRTTDAFLARRTFDGDATTEIRPGWLKRR